MTKSVWAESSAGCEAYGKESAKNCRRHMWFSWMTCYRLLERHGTFLFERTGMFQITTQQWCITTLCNEASQHSTVKPHNTLQWGITTHCSEASTTLQWGTATLYSEASTTLCNEASQHTAVRPQQHSAVRHCNTLHEASTTLCNEASQHSAVRPHNTLQWGITTLCSEASQHTAVKPQQHYNEGSQHSAVKHPNTALCWDASLQCCEASKGFSLTTLQWSIPTLCSEATQHSALKHSESLPKHCTAVGEEDDSRDRVWHAYMCIICILNESMKLGYD